MRRQPIKARLRARSATIATTVTSIVGPDELLLATALILIAAGAWLVWKPGAFLAPGIVLLWIGLPTRKPLIERPAVSEKSDRRKDA